MPFVCYCALSPTPPPGGLFPLALALNYRLLPIIYFHLIKTLNLLVVLNKLLSLNYILEMLFVKFKHQKAVKMCLNVLDENGRIKL